jgi:uncharacterized protein YqjF (DUF2071 family)
MKSRCTAEGRIHYESRRTGLRANGSLCLFDYAPGEDLPRPAPDSLEFFLVERYRLFSSAPDGLRRGSVFHEPYPLCRAELAAWDENLLSLNGFALTNRPPGHVIMSRGVDVTIFPQERVRFTPDELVRPTPDFDKRNFSGGLSDFKGRVSTV